MRISPGTLTIILSALSSINMAECFMQPIRALKHNGLRELKYDCINKSALLFSVHSKEVPDDRHQDHHHTPCPTVLGDCQLEHWSKFCEDVDKNMEGLVSPAPESFHALHSVVSKINDERISFDGNSLEGSNYARYLDDLKALSSFLVKPNHTVELYLDSGLLKWRLVKGACGKSRIIHPFGSIPEGEAEVYHDCNTLQLSRMALDIATKTPGDPDLLTKVHYIAQQAEKRLTLTMGLDLRGPTASDACFNFALSGVQHSCNLFHTLTCIGIHELKRTGLRASFQPKHILHMIEKYAASDIHGQHALDLCHLAGVCLEKKGYDDDVLIGSLKNGSFGFHSPRPLIWLWRFSTRQKKVPASDIKSIPKRRRNIDWAEIFNDTSNPLVVDVGSGMGASLLNLSVINADHCTKDKSRPGGDKLQIPWSECNYAGADLNQAMANFGNGIISRDTRREGRVHFFCLSAEDFLRELMFYPGGVSLIMINFPTPYSIGDAGNSQLPSKQSNQFMVTKIILTMIADLLSKPVTNGGEGLFLFQTKCEDVAVHVRKECTSLGVLESVTCKDPVKNIDLQYKKCGKKPKRVDEWLRSTPSSERAEGEMYSTVPLLPRAGIPETEAQCNYDSTFVHRCIFRRTT